LNGNRLDRVFGFILKSDVKRGQGKGNIAQGIKLFFEFSSKPSSASG
jgi:hypothetical protein